MRILFLLIASLSLLGASIQAQVRAVVPQKMAAASDVSGSPAIDAGDYVYVSGQGPRRADGSVAANFADQVRQCLQNISSVIEAAGLTMEQTALALGISRATAFRHWNYARAFIRCALREENSAATE